MNIEPATLICLKEAAKLVPSHQAGKCINIQTLARWCQLGKLPAVKRNGYWFVRPEDLEQLYQPHRALDLSPPRVGIPAHVRERLARHGLYV